ncbi:thiosulfate:glutathione sulfurtransferase isoform X2 [Emys orbicularis]|uniref:thiosulfate:glutathione sulfurtransferase isoform X2 n=1 Tax=Emys orbicularis TaxID=82168 RepID=UPI0031FE2D5B
MPLSRPVFQLQKLLGQAGRSLGLARVSSTPAPGSMDRVTEVEEALKMDPETFKMKYGVDKPRMDDKNLIFHCQMGRRGAQATEIAMTLGYAKARNYAGGYKEWSEKEGK